MSYDISFRVKVEGTDKYITTEYCSANITWNLRNMIVQSTGLEWVNEANNGLCKDVVPKIKIGLFRLLNFPKSYKKYESPNGWGTIDGCVRFFQAIVKAWEQMKEEEPELAEVATFWID